MTQQPKAKLLSITCNGELLPFTFQPATYRGPGSSIHWEDGTEQCEDCGKDISEDSACTGQYVVCGCGKSYPCKPFAWKE
jgi:hypothetical protein